MKNKKIYVLMVCLAVVLTGCGFNLEKKANAPEIKKEAQQGKQDKIENITIISKNSPTSTRAGSEECALFLNPLNQGSLEKCLYNKFSTSTITNGVLNISKRNIFAKPINEDDIAEIKYKNIGVENLFGEGRWGLILISPEGKEFLIPENLAGKFNDIVASPYKKDIIFTSEVSSDNPCVNKLYSYNLATKELTEFYSEVRKSSDPVYDGGECINLLVEGMQGSKLILLGEGSNGSGGVCTDIWFEKKSSFLYIDLADIKQGVKKFIVPSGKAEEAQRHTLKCSQDVKNGIIP